LHLHAYWLSSFFFICFNIQLNPESYWIDLDVMKPIPCHKGCGRTTTAMIGICSHCDPNRRGKPQGKKIIKTKSKKNFLFGKGNLK
jgi:hypothetical protein